MLSAGNQDSLFGAIGVFMQGYKTGSVAPPPQRPLVVAPYGGQHCQRNCINIGNALSGPMLPNLLLLSTFGYRRVTKGEKPLGMGLI
jgi:hypothetical protein